jgi:hypothetical protein
VIDPGVYVRSAFRHLDGASLLRQAVDVLIGVSPEAKAELALQNIDTVFDLATSSLFREAGMLAAAADSPEADWAVAGMAPKQVVDSAIATLPVMHIADRNIADLRSLTDAAAGRMSAALHLETIRELSAWAPYLAAKLIYGDLLGKGTTRTTLDPGTPPELLPTMGRHPTERAYYQSILLDRFLEAPKLDPRFGSHAFELPRHSVPLAIEAVGQVDIASPLLRSPGFEKVGVGALIQFSQSWYTAGLSLGQLLHSLALAPGESTRIAMIDWQRRERGSQTQNTAESDRLSNQQVHNRALNEVVSAVAHEVQSGASASQASGESWGLGKSGGGGMSWGGDGMGAGFGGGYSIGFGTGKGQASSWSVSSGDRDLRSELSQNIQDLTQQASTMARNRWATVVQEVSQEEHEQLSTRAVTNYNHMHALTVQYYEVVQIYRVAIEIDRITRCVFIPMRALDFSRREIVSRFRDAIAANALIPQVRTAFRSARGTTILTLAPPSASWDLRTIGSVYGAEAWTSGAREAVVPEDDWQGFVIGSNDAAHPFRTLVIEYHDGSIKVVPWNIGDRSAPDAGSPFGLYDFASPPRDPPQGFRMSSVRRILLRRGADQAGFDGVAEVTFFGRSESHDGAWTGGTISLRIAPGTGDIPLIGVDRGIDYTEIADHLRDNALHYSQGIWRSLDAASVSLALSGYTFNGRPLMESVDPMPVGIAGNYMILRTYAEDETWASFLRNKRLMPGPVSSTVVPLPSGGVFAEAVLGRSNSAERLELGRFWNWQDSPIPIAAPDIAALQAGSRAQATNLQTGQLSPSVLNIMNPTSLPDPTGMTAALAALAQGAMFRDMSGLASTIGLAGTALTEAHKGSSDAQQYAAENFRTAASIIGKTGGRPSTTSEQGAKLNHAQDMDARDHGTPGSVGPAEKRAFDDALSAPPLVEAVPYTADEWAPWPGATDGEVPPPKPVPRTPRPKPSTVIPVTLKLRVFVPSEVWEPYPSLFNLGGGFRYLRYLGDHRGFQATGGTSRAELECSLRINADTLEVTEPKPGSPHYGWAEAYKEGDTVDVDNKPEWWEAKRDANVTSLFPTRRMNPERGKFEADIDALGNRVEVVFTLEAKPYFPWKVEDFSNDQLDVEVAGVTLRALLNTLMSMGARDLDAQVRVTITKRVDGMLEYNVSGWHDQFPAYELYINGEPAYRYGSEAQLSADDAPEAITEKMTIRAATGQIKADP